MIVDPNSPVIQALRVEITELSNEIGKTLSLVVEANKRALVHLDTRLTVLEDIVTKLANSLDSHEDYDPRAEKIGKEL